MPLNYVDEFHQYITPDGVTYELDSMSRLGRWVMSASSWGLPPIDYITQRGPFQHGNTVRDFFLSPRVIQLLVYQRFCDRDDLWAGRAALLDAIRPNRQAVFTAAVPGVLRRLLSDGSLRDLDVFISTGPKFEGAQGGWREWSFEEVLRFIANNPVVYDPTDLTQSNWCPCAGAVNVNQNVQYDGTWEEYPTLIITGPLNNAQITNNATGEVIALTYNIPAAAPGNVITITLTPGDKTVVDDAGVNRIGVVTTVSDLATFHLAPDPEAANGVNQINLQGAAAAAATDFEIQWRTRYIGI